MINESCIAVALKGTVSIDSFSISIDEGKFIYDLNSFAETTIRKAMESAVIKDGERVSLEIKVGVKRI